MRGGWGDALQTAQARRPAAGFVCRALCILFARLHVHLYPPVPVAPCPAGDLKNADVPISFGFDTACKVYRS